MSPLASPADPPFSPSTQNRSPAHGVFFGRDGLRAGWSLLLFGALLYLSGFALTHALHALYPHRPRITAGHVQSPSEILFYEATSFFLISLVTLIMARIERRPLRIYGIGLTPRAPVQFLTGLGWGLLLLAILVGLLRAFHLLIFSGRLLAGVQIPKYAAVWFIGFLLVALSEEYLLRGYLQFTLARGLGGAFRSVSASPFSQTLGFWLAAVLLSLLFGLGHKGNPGESPLGLASAALIGLVFCLSLWRTGSLWWAIGFHAAWDWAQSFLFGVADSGTMIQFHLLSSIPQGKPILSGGTTGPEGSILILAIVLAAAAIVVSTLPSAPWPTSGSSLLLDPQPEASTGNSP